MAQAKSLIDLLDQMAPEVQRAFLDSLNRVTSRVQLRALEQAIASGDVDAVLRILELGAEYFAPLDRALTDAFTRGGDWAFDQIVMDGLRNGAAVRGFFDARNIRAEQWVRRQSSYLVTRITKEQRDLIRVALRAGSEAGEGPRATALRLVGRINRKTGRREGGIIGLTAQQEVWTRNAMRELLDGDPAYFERKQRDRRFDKLLANAIRDGRGVSMADAQRMVARYSDKLLKLRGDTIARTELLQSLHQAQNEALQQMVDSGKVKAHQIARIWDAANDMDTRDSHRAMDNQERRLGAAFTTGAGYQMMFPGDRSHGAPAEEIINCRCVLKIDVDWIAGFDG